MAVRTRESLVDQGSAGPHRLQGVKDGGKLFILHIDQIQGFLGGVRIIGGDGGHPFADEPHLPVGQQRHVPQRPPHQHTGHILPRHHGAHSAQSKGAGGVYVNNSGVGERAPQDPSLEHPRQHNIRRVNQLPRYFIRAVFPGNWFPTTA